MKARIDINMDGAAFADQPLDELHRILWELCGRIKRREVINESDIHGPLALRDINGNKVGKLTITGGN